jgi:hypothetical protein
MKVSCCNGNGFIRTEEKILVHKIVKSSWGWKSESFKDLNLFLRCVRGRNVGPAASRGPQVDPKRLMYLLDEL